MKKGSFLLIVALAANYACNTSNTEDARTSADMEETVDDRTMENERLEDDLMDEDRDRMIVVYEERKERESLRLDSLKARIKSLGPKAEAEWNETIEDLELREKDIDARWGNLKSSSKDAWNDVENAFEDAVAEMEQALDKVERDLEE